MEGSPSYANRLGHATRRLFGVSAEVSEQAQADAVAAQRIYEALNADPTYYFRHVDVRVDGGVAELRGYIWGTQALYRAKEIAAGVPGVRTVVNDMELEREGSQGGASHEGGG